MSIPIQALLDESAGYLGAGLSQSQALQVALLARIVANGGVSQPAAKYVVTSASYAPTVGIPVAISAQLASANGTAVKTPGLVVTWSKTGAGGSFSAPTSVTDANGIATVNFTPSNTAGVVYAITATDTNAMTGTSANITSVAGAATAYVVTSNNYSPAAGATVAASAQLVDAHGNSVSTAGITVTWSKTGAGGSFSAPTSNTNGSGVATVNFTCGTVAGVVYVLTGTDGSARTGSSSNVTVGPEAAAKYIVTSSDYGPVAGSNITITAQLTDIYDNAVSTAGLTVTWTKTITGGSFASPTSNTNGSGVATIVFTTPTTAGFGGLITGTDGGGLTGHTSSIETVAGPATKYLVTSSSYAPVAGADVTITAQLSDANNNAVATSGLTVTWSKTGAGGSFGSPTSNTNGSGIATVTFTTGTTAGVAYVVTGTDGGGLTGSTTAITSVAGAAAKYLVTSSTYAPIAGQGVTISAQLADANNNAVSTSGLTVTWSKTGTGGSFASGTSNTNGSGIAQVVFTTSVTPTTYTVTGTDAGALTGTSSNIVSAYSSMVDDWAARVITNGGAAVSAGTKDAVNKFYLGMVTDGLDALMIADLHVVPDNLTAARTPFFKNAGSDPWTNHNFVAGDLTVNGLVGNGSSKYLETGVNPTSVYASDNDGGYTYYESALSVSLQSMRLLAVDNVSAPNRYDGLDARAGGGTTLEGAINAAWTSSYTLTSDYASFCSVNRTASNAVGLYQANSSIGFNTRNTSSAAAGTRVNFQLFAFVWNLNNGTPLFYSAGRASYFGIHKGMNATQAQNYYNRVQQLRVDLGGGYA